MPNLRNRRRLYRKDFSISPFSYKVGNGGLLALDYDPKEIKFDKSLMTATGIFSTAARDRGGDIVDIAGIVTTEHRANPVVLLDHGVAYPAPIGMNQDPNGNYTVSIDPDLGEATQTTYFSQKTDMAHQVYHLICEGILRANSFGYRLLQFRRLPMDPRMGMTTSNKHIQSCELVETTWCGVPMNQECVMPILSKGMIDGRKIAPCIKSMLSACAPERKVWSNGFGKGKAMTQSSLDETSGGALRKDKKHMNQLEAPMPTDVKDADGAADSAANVNPEDNVEGKMPRESHGCLLLRDMHRDLKKFHDLYSEENNITDHPEVKAHIQGILDSLMQHHGSNHDMFAKTYAEAAPLADDPEETEDKPHSGHGEGEEMEEGEGARVQDKNMDTGKKPGHGDGEESEEDEEVRMGTNDKKKSFASKSMTKDELKSLKQIKDFLEEMAGEDNHKNTVKLAMKSCAKAVDEIHKTYQKVGRVVADPAATIEPPPKHTVVKGKSVNDPDYNAALNKALAIDRALDRKLKIIETKSAETVEA